MAEFSLDVSEIEKNVQDSFKEEEEKLEESKLKDKAEENALAIFEIDLNNPTQREAITRPIDKFGVSDISRSSTKNQLLSVRFVDLNKQGNNAETIGNDLSDLNRQLRDLDPSNVDFLKTGVLSGLFDPVRRYFEKYEKAETAIANIVKSLELSKKGLENDNVTLLNEEQYLREVTIKLLSSIELGKQMDKSIESQIEKAELSGIDEEKITFVKEEVLFPLRQRIMDMEQMIVVNQQGIISINVIRRNNKELIRGVTRANNVTISALRTGVMLASALHNQKVVMDKLDVLNKTTENIIQSTSHMLRDQGNKIQKQSAETMISPEVLKAAFDEAIAAVDELSVYKESALPKMKETINVFNEMAVQGQKVVERIETSNDMLLN